MKKDFYVYVYYRLDTNEPFYVGKGRKHRWKALNKRSSHFKRILNKYDVVCEILYDNLTEEQAHGIECYLIHELVFEYGFSIDIKNNRSSDGDWFHLVNATWGGEGTSGLVHTEESKRKMSENSNKEGIKVVLLNTLEIFDTIKEGAKKYNLDPSSVRECCNGNRNSYGKLNKKCMIWVKYEDYLNMTQEEINKRLDYNYTLENNNGKKVICLDTLEIFESRASACKKYNIDKKSLRECCNGKRKSAKGLHWMNYEDYLELQIS